VVFERFSQSPNDARFQQVSGLSAATEVEPWPEGGENRFTYQLPKKLHFSDLVLKRGKFLGSGLLQWARKAIEEFEFQPTNLTISLLDAHSAPLCSWYVVNAVPKQLEVSGIDASSNQIAVESLTLSYQYFKYYEQAGAGS